jgi:hypothetical protein
MSRGLVPSPHRPLRALFAASLLLATACEGEVAGPHDVCSDCTTDGPLDGMSPGDDDDDDDGLDGPTTGDTDRPDGVGNPATPDGVGWSTRFPKLSNRQWEDTVQALFYLTAPTGMAKDFTQEPLDKAYEPQAAAELTIGGDAWTRYQTAAETVASMIVGDDAKLAKLAPTGTFADANAKGAAFIAQFGRRAYRRPLAKEEQDAYLTLFKAGPTLVGGDAYKAGVQLVIQGMLQSPFFLYRVESSGGTGKVALSGHEVATRLSYALWGTMPSDELFTAAAAGELDTKEGVGRWASKLLDDPRAKPVLLAFHEQTFQVASFGTQDKDPTLGFKVEELAPVMRSEAQKFFEHVVVEQNGGIAALLTEPTAFVNEDTAPFYGLTGVTGKELIKQPLNPAERAGLLTQLGFLTKNATRNTSDPVHRGLAVLRKVLCDEPDPPPMMFELPSSMPGMTTREVYEKATVCGGACHAKLINPPGFAFETFDAIGRFRQTEIGRSIDATGTLDLRVGYTPAAKKATAPTQITFNGAVDMVTQLSKQPRVHECYARNWMQFVLAREVDGVEQGAWEVLRDSSMKDKSARAILTRLVQLDTFRTRVSD